MRKKLFQSHSRGFTLIEMLVVVAITGVMATVVFGAVSLARERARVAKSKSEASQIMRAAELVYHEYGYYPNDSHGSVICPKDIVIHEASGRVWGDFIKLCDGPWGYPAEWNNKCGNGSLRKPHAPYDPGCASFSDSDPGPVGLTILGKNGVNDGCTGDDLCIGTRGHAIYGWDGQVTESGGSGLMCVTQTADCASLSPLGCISRSGCTLGNFGCTGSYDTSCSGISNENSCTSLAGCSWSAGGCSGTAFDCLNYSDSVSCGNASGCTWTSGSSSCTGSAGSCSLANYGSQTSCQSAGCNWGTSSSCTGSYACSQWNGTNATTCTTGHPGCTWSSGGGGKCNGGSQSCTAFSQSACTPSGCSWTSSNTCTGSPTSCTSYGDSVSCGGALGCSWTTGSSTCSGIANCSYGDSTSCGASGCNWTTPSCQGTYSTSCTGYSDQNSCQTQASCTWSDGVCSGTASLCTDFSDQNSCQSQAGCSWQ